MFYSVNCGPSRSNCSKCVGDRKRINHLLLFHLTAFQPYGRNRLVVQVGNSWPFWERRNQLSLEGWKTELGIPNESRYFGTTGGIFRYRNTEYNIGTDTDSERIIPKGFRYLWNWISRAYKESSLCLHYIFIRVDMSVRGIRHHNNAWQVTLLVRNCS